MCELCERVNWQVKTDLQYYVNAHFEVAVDGVLEHINEVGAMHQSLQHPDLVTRVDRAERCCCSGILYAFRLLVHLCLRSRPQRGDSSVHSQWMPEMCNAYLYDIAYTMAFL